MMDKIARSVVFCSAVAVLAAFGTAPAIQAEELRFEYLFTIGSSGINPSQRLSGRFGKLFFGAPERVSPLVAPDSVTVDPEERIWITDRGSASVHMFNLLDNSYKVLRGSGRAGFQCPSGIDSDIHGNIYVADACSGQIHVFDKSGEFERVLFSKSKKRLQQPAALAVSRDLKSIYVTDPPRHKVVVFNQEGESIREWGGPAEFELPTALALDSDRIFVLDSGKRRVQVFSPGGALLSSLGWNQVRHPSAMAFDPSRSLFFLGDRDFEVVHVVNEAGFPVGIFGQSGSSEGEVHAPGSIYVDLRQRIYVVDPLNAKVLVFRESQDEPYLPWLLQK